KDSVPKYNQEWATIPEGSPVSQEAHECPPTHPLLPPPLLSSGSPSARPQPTIHMVQALRVCYPPPSPWLDLLGLDFALACRPSGSTSASNSFGSTVTRRSTSSTGLPYPLVGRYPAITSGLCSSGFTLLLCPTGSVGLLPPASSTFVLSRSDSVTDLRLGHRALGSTLVPGSSASPWLVGSPSPPRAPPTPAPPL
ncbi:hypothetical protein M9458_039780, partial [Cirrhinus mrigala]